MLNSGTLEGSQLTVTSDVIHQDEETEAPNVEGAPPSQEDKPRAGSTSIRSGVFDKVVRRADAVRFVAGV